MAPANIQDKIRGAVKAIEGRDPRLSEELKSKRASAVVEEAPADLISEGGHAFPSDVALETIVLRTGRPVLAINHDEPTLEFRDVESEVWRDRLRTAHDLLVARIPSVGRIQLQNNPSFDWVGTGWLVREDIVVTNRHVASEFARRRSDGFVFRVGPAGGMKASIDFLQEIDNSDTSEFEVSRVLHIERDNGPDLAFLQVRALPNKSLPTPIEMFDGEVMTDDFVAVVGYPARDSRIPEQDLMDSIFGDVYNKKRLAPGQIMSVDGTLVQHDCSTLGGNSGSAVLSLQHGSAVALHFSGRFLEGNYAVPTRLITDRLKSLRNSSLRISVPDLNRTEVSSSSTEQLPTPGAATAVFRQMLTVTVQLGPPQDISASIRPAGTGVAQAHTHPAQTTEREEEATEDFLEGRVEDYRDREGYDTKFLGRNNEVALPKVPNSDLVTFDSDGKQDHVLKYEHFSVSMRRSRRMCFYSAANIDGSHSRRLKRSSWRLDPRVPKEFQIMKECYGNPPKFSRGHMTRREDPIWGTPSAAARGNQDSMHVTNVVPQMQPFNAPIWLGLEDYALEHAREDDMLISVFTGPFFSEKDPVRFGIMIPVVFWKIIAFIHDDTQELCATGYTMSQRSFLQEEEFVFGQHETSQVPISTIQSRSGLDFGVLPTVDPLRGGEESISVPLTDYAQIRFY